MKVIAIVALVGCGSAHAPVNGTREVACRRIDAGSSVADRAAAFAALRSASAACRAEPAAALATALGVPVDEVLRAAVASTAIKTAIPERADRPAIASPDGTRFAIALPHRVAVYSTTTGLPIASIPLDTGGHNIALLDGGELVDASFEGVFVLDATGARRTTLREHAAGAAPLDTVVPAAAPDGRHVALIDRTSIAIVARDGTRTATAPREQAQNPRWATWRGTTLVIWDGSVVELWRASVSALALVAKHEASFTILHEGLLTEQLPAVAITHDGTAVAIAGRSGIALVGAEGSARTITPNVSVSMLGYDHGALRAIDLNGDLWRFDGDRAVQLDIDTPPPSPPAMTPGEIVISPFVQRLPIGVAWTEVADAIVAGTTGRLVVHDGRASLAAAVSAGPPVTALAWLSQDALAIASIGQIAVAAPDGIAETKSAAFPGDALVFPGGPRVWLVSADGAPRPAQTWARGDTAPRAAPVPVAMFAAFTTDGARVAVTPTYGHDLELHDAANGTLLETIHIPELAGLPAQQAAFVDRDRTLVVGDATHTIVWNTSLKVATWTLQEPLFGASPDGAVVVTNAYDKLEAYDLPHQRRIGELALDTIGDVAAFRPDGKQLAIGTRAGTILLVDLPSWRVTRTIAAHDLEVTALAWRPDGALLASASAGGTVALWSPGGERRATLAFGVSDLFDTTTAPSWVALFPDGTTYGPGRAHVMTSLGGIPLGLGGAPAAADASAWRALFAAP